MDELWTQPEGSTGSRKERPLPLAAKMRPESLDELVGQPHLLSEGKLLRRAILADQFSAFIFYGPPGTGKTTLARVISQETACRFETLNATEANTSDLRKQVEQAESWYKLRNERTIVFIDEIHRFTKNQQDVLLPHLEEGVIRLIGATTENPFYALNNALLSRAQLFQLEPIEESDLVKLLENALQNKEKGYGNLDINATEEALKHIAQKAGGDARKALSALELAMVTTPKESTGEITLNLEIAEECIQQKAVRYDAKGDEHYDTASAFIKSIRGSDPDAALYWLAKMLHAGEDPRFIARRLVISASEDIGLADSNGLRVALSAQQAFEFLGMPEGRIPLAHAAVYLATAPKSNAAYEGLGLAMKDIRENKTLAVPPHLRTKTRKKLAASTDLDNEALKYHYSHDYEENYVPQAYLEEGRTYYSPTENGLEQRIKERMEYFKKKFQG